MRRDTRKRNGLASRRANRRRYIYIYVSYIYLYGWIYPIYGPWHPWRDGLKLATKWWMRSVILSMQIKLLCSNPACFCEYGADPMFWRLSSPSFSKMNRFGILAMESKWESMIMAMEIKWEPMIRITYWLLTSWYKIAFHLIMRAYVNCFA